jgi:hypothetical protein
MTFVVKTLSVSTILIHILGKSNYLYQAKKDLVAKKAVVLKTAGSSESTGCAISLRKYLIVTLL